MERVIGIGGIFFKAHRPAELQQWYKRHLGLDVQEWGGTAFRSGAPGDEATTVWSIFPDSTRYFQPSSAPFMINYRVRDLDTVLALLRAEGVTVDERVEESEFGRFGWAMDPEGNRFELWQPPAAMPGLP